jgi:uncharacterized protein (DUF362 family)
MAKNINRREFIKKSTAIGVGAVLGDKLSPGFTLGNETPDIVVVTSEDYIASTKKAVELLGGMKRFVPKGSKVALLPNPQSSNPGTYTKPEIVRAAAQMCKEAGAKEIGCLGWLSKRYWKNTGIKKVLDDEGVDLVIARARDESLFKPVPVPKGVLLKEARIMKAFFDYDVFLDMNISKEHSGNNLSCSMKNLMGINSPKSDQTFHRRGRGGMDDIEHLDQCIADLNTVIHPDLCIIDSTVFVTTNGPDGPGKLKKPQKVIAGTDRVAIDSYCATLFGYDPKDVTVLNKAYEHGLGEMDLSKVNIVEIEL